MYVANWSNKIYVELFDILVKCTQILKILVEVLNTIFYTTNYQTKNVIFQAKAISAFQ